MSRRDRTELVLGKHAALAALRAGGLRELLISPGVGAEVIEIARKSGVPMRQLSRAKLSSLVHTDYHQGVVAVCAVKPGNSWRQLKVDKQTIIIGFDGVQDPRNLGACLRSAAAFNVVAAIQPRRGNTRLTPVARRASTGGDQAIVFEQVANLARELQALQDAGFRVFGADAVGRVELNKADLSGPIVWVFGGEGDGLRRLTRENCDVLVKIPMPKSSVANLNVSVACGICLAATYNFQTSNNK